jgi:FtsP/CotA-like multicopper oxidase with cupredoxin domain
MRRGKVVAAIAATICCTVVPGSFARATREPPRPSPDAPVETSTAAAQSGHEDAEGLKLIPAVGETVRGGGASDCGDRDRVRRYDVSAIAVDITVNRYLDHDPQGRMYALDGEVARIRREEAANARARTGNGESAVTAGLQGDAIQPLVLRVLPGECLRVRLRNRLPGNEPASFHVHG